MLYPAGVGLPLTASTKACCNAHRPAIGGRATAAIARDATHHQARVFALCAGPVGLDQLAQPLPAQPPLAHDALLDGGKRVRHRGERRGVQTKVHILHPVVRGVQPLFDGPIAAQVQRQLGKDLMLVLDVEIIDIGHGVHGLLQVPGEAAPTAQPRSALGCIGHQVAKGQLEHPPKVDLGAVVQAVLAARAWRTSGSPA